jgi:hypothetical protein
MTTKEWALKLARGQKGDMITRALRDTCVGMTRNLKAVPRTARTLYEIRRSRPDRRREHLLETFMQVAVACAEDGAPYLDISRPLHEADSILRARFHLTRLPSLEEAQQLETDAEYRLNKIQIVLDSHSPRHLVADAREAAFGHRTALQTLLDVLDALYHTDAAPELVKAAR